MRNSILGDGGRAKEAQSEFLILLENATRQPDQERAAIPAVFRRSKGASEFCGNTRGLVDAHDKGRRKHRDKRDRAAPHGRWPIEN